MSETAADAAALQTEINRLRAENEELRGQGSQRRSGVVRSTAVAVLIVLGTLLTVPGIAAPWLRTQLLDTNRYVETMQPIIQDPAVVDYLATRITDRIFENVDIQKLLSDNLPPQLSFAAGPISGQVQSTTQSLVVRALDSHQFDTLWAEVNRQAQTSIVQFLTTGDSSELSVSPSNKLVLNLAPIVAGVKSRLADGGLSFVNNLPTLSQNLDVEIGDASILVQARQAVRLLQLVAWLFPVLAIGCFALAIGLSRRRRRALTWSGLGLAGGALTLAILLALGRSGFLNAMSSASVPVDASTAVFDVYVRFLRNSIRLVLLIGLLVALFSVLTGPTPGAVAIRTKIGGLLTGAGAKSGFDSGPVGRWLAAHRTAANVGIVVLGGLVFLLVDGPTPKFVLLLVVIGLVLLAVVQVLVAAAAPKVEDKVENKVETADT